LDSNVGCINHILFSLYGFFLGSVNTK